MVTQHPMNIQRAEGARKCLREVADYDPDDEETAIKDLMTNLMHLTTQTGLSFADIVEKAFTNYLAETTEVDDLEQDMRRAHDLANNPGDINQHLLESLRDTEADDHGW